MCVHLREVHGLSEVSYDFVHVALKIYPVSLRGVWVLNLNNFGMWKNLDRHRQGRGGVEPMNNVHLWMVEPSLALSIYFTNVKVAATFSFVVPKGYQVERIS